MAVTFPQNTVQDQLSVPFPGVIVHTGNKHIASRVSAEVSAEIPFGVALLRDTTDKDNGAVLPHTDSATSAPLFAGILAHSHAYDKDIELGDVGLKPKVTLMVLERGQMWVQPEEAVTPGDAVRFRAVVAGNEQAGAFRSSADASDCVDISTFARWVTSGDANTPCKLEIDVIGASQASAD